MIQNPKVSVIVPMYNAAKTIKNCLDSIFSLDYPNFEVILVDDASTDNSILIVSGMPCKLIVLDRNSGPGIARNEGVKLATGEIVAFTDADCEVPKNWLKKIIKDFQDYPVVAVSGGYSKLLGNGLIALFQFYDTSFRQRNIPQYINSCITSNLACKKEIFEEIGGFPPLHINEDMEFAMTVSRKYKILWDKDNGVSHYYSNNFFAYFVKQILWSESVVRLYLSEPKSIFRKNTYNNSEILLNLLFIVLLYFSLATVALSFKFIIWFLLLLILYLFVSIGYIKFVAEKNGYILSCKIFPLLLVRNTAWIGGIIKAVLKYFTNILWSLKLRKISLAEKINNIPVKLNNKE